MSDLPAKIESAADHLSTLLAQYADGKFQAIVDADGNVCLRKTFHRTAQPMVRVAEALQELKEAMHAAYGVWPCDQSQITQGLAVIVLGTNTTNDKIVWHVEPGEVANG